MSKELEKKIDDLKSERHQLLNRVKRLEQKNDNYFKIILLQLDLLQKLTNNLKE